MLSKLYQQKHCAVFLWQHLMVKLALDEGAPTGGRTCHLFLTKMRQSNWESIPSNEFRRVKMKNKCLKQQTIVKGDNSPNNYLALKIQKCPGNQTPRWYQILKIGISPNTWEGFWICWNLKMTMYVLGNLRRNFKSRFHHDHLWWTLGMWSEIQS